MEIQLAKVWETVSRNCPPTVPEAQAIALRSSLLSPGSLEQKKQVKAWVCASPRCGPAGARALPPRPRFPPAPRAGRATARHLSSPSAVCRRRHPYPVNPGHLRSTRERNSFKRKTSANSRHEIPEDRPWQSKAWREYLTRAAPFTRDELKLQDMKSRPGAARTQTPDDGNTLDIARHEIPAWGSTVPKDEQKPVQAGEVRKQGCRLPSPALTSSASLSPKNSGRHLEPVDAATRPR